MLDSNDSGWCWETLVLVALFLQRSSLSVINILLVVALVETERRFVVIKQEIHLLVPLCFRSHCSLAWVGRGGKEV